MTTRLNALWQGSQVAARGGFCQLHFFLLREAFISAAT
jgi:hypothetical protein